MDDIITQLIGEGTTFDARLVTATVEAATADAATLRYTDTGGASVTAIMPVTETLPGHSFVVGETIIALRCDTGARPLLSMTDPRIAAAALEGISPEVRSGSVRVMVVARRAGARTKVAVAATEAGVDPVAACVGRNHNRVDDIRATLGGEQVDIVAWHPDKSIFLRNALQPAVVDDVTFDEATGEAVAIAPRHQMSAAIGGGGLNSSLAGRLVGVGVRIETAQ